MRDDTKVLVEFVVASASPYCVLNSVRDKSWELMARVRNWPEEFRLCFGSNQHSLLFSKAGFGDATLHDGSRNPRGRPVT